MDQNMTKPEGKAERPTYTAPSLKTFSDEDLHKMFPEVLAQRFSGN